MVKSLKIIASILISSATLGCNSGNEKVGDYCKCAILESIDKKTARGQDSSDQSWGVGANGGIEAVVKKAIDTKISISGSYSNSSTKIEEVYTEITGSNPQITQKANLYRSIACAYYEIICQDKSLSEKEKTERLREVVAGYEDNIYKIIDEETTKKAETQNRDTIKPNKFYEEEKTKPTKQTAVIEPINTEAESPQKYSSKVSDKNGKGIANVEIYCSNCIVQKMKTAEDGSFHLEGYFDENATFWQSTITLSKDKKSKTETINWREKSPQPINF